MATRRRQRSRAVEAELKDRGTVKIAPADVLDRLAARAAWSRDDRKNPKHQKAPDRLKDDQADAGGRSHDFAAAIRIGPAPGDFTGVVGFGFDERHLGC